MKKDLTVKKPRLIIILLGWFFILCSVYISLVMGDYVLARSYLISINSEAQEIIEIRKVEEDQKMIEEAKKKNLSPLVAPWMFWTFSRRNIGFWESISKYDLAPLGSINNEETYYCNEGYGLVTYKTDRFGFRNNNNIWNNLKDIDTYVIGDSFVEGSCVHQGETITDRLNSLGNNSVNLGASGNTPIQYAATLKTFFYLHNPKNIVVIFYANDNVQNDQNDNYYKLFLKGNSSERYFDKGVIDLSKEMKALLETTKKLVLKETTETIEIKGIFFKALLIRGRHYIALENLRRAIRGIFGSQNKIPFSTKLAIDTLYNLCNKNSNCNPVVGYIPNSIFWGPDPRAQNYKLLLKQYVENSGYKLVDLSDKITKNESENFAPKGPHYSPKGYSIVAEGINPFLIR